MMTSQQKRKRESESEDDVFRTNSRKIIDKMVELSEQTADSTILVDELLHSIFFLGLINNPSYSPQDILSDKKKFNNLKTRFPNPFDLYSSQLPTRSPISCLLDMIVKLTGQEKEGEIIKKMQHIINQLSRGFRKKPLISFTICVSQKNKIRSEDPDPDRYYGVSMSTSGRVPGKIMVAASCLSNWNSHVADAIMTYIPDGVKKSYFDGTIELQRHVSCNSYSISSREKIPPCKACGNLFGLHTKENTEWAYGNCAEVESLSNLLTHEIDIEANPSSVLWTYDNRQKAKTSVRVHLNRLLKDIKVFKWDNTFYTPQEALPP